MLTCVDLCLLKGKQPSTEQYLCPFVSPNEKHPV